MANLAGLSSPKEAMKMEMEGLPLGEKPLRKRMRSVAPSENMDDLEKITEPKVPAPPFVIKVAQIWPRSHRIAKCRPTKSTAMCGSASSATDQPPPKPPDRPPLPLRFTVPPFFLEVSLKKVLEQKQSCKILLFFLYQWSSSVGEKEGK
jgi:hypothetical protein